MAQIRTDWGPKPVSIGHRPIENERTAHTKKREIEIFVMLLYSADVRRKRMAR